MTLDEQLFLMQFSAIKPSETFREYISSSVKVRSLILDGSPLAYRVVRDSGYNKKLKYSIRANIVFDETKKAHFFYIAPIASEGFNHTDVYLDKFLATKTLFYKYKYYTVLDVLMFAVIHLGGAHTSEITDEKWKNFLGLMMNKTIQSHSISSCFKGIFEVIIKALEPLEEFILERYK